MCSRFHPEGPLWVPQKQQKKSQQQADQPKLQQEMQVQQ